jgi:hypothetical protein
MWFLRDKYILGIILDFSVLVEMFREYATFLKYGNQLLCNRLNTALLLVTVRLGIG